MAVFSRYKEWSDGDEFESLACLLAGKEVRVPRPKDSDPRKPTWRFGLLGFNSNKTIAYVDGATLPTGVSRPVCIVEKARYGDFFTHKGGKKKPKLAYVRAKFDKKKVKGKWKDVLVPRIITLPTTGITSTSWTQPRCTRTCAAKACPTLHGQGTHRVRRPGSPRLQQAKPLRLRSGRSTSSHRVAGRCPFTANITIRITS